MLTPVYLDCVNPEVEKDDYHRRIEIVRRLTKMIGSEWGTGYNINPVLRKCSRVHEKRRIVLISFLL